MSTNSPYLQKLLSTVALNEEVLERLKFRITKLEEKCKLSTTDEYDFNEYRITIIKTQNEIDVLSKVIKEKKEYFEMYAKEYESDLQEMKQNFANIVRKAKEVRGKSKPIDHALSTVNWGMLEMEQHEEEKVFFYKKLKGLLAKI